MAKTKSKGKDEEEKEGGKKPKPQLTEKQLDDAATAVEVVVDGQKLIGEKKEFSSGSVGWNVNGKVVISGLKCQVSANIIIVGSKNVEK